MSLCLPITTEEVYQITYEVKARSRAAAKRQLAASVPEGDNEPNGKCDTGGIRHTHDDQSRWTIKLKRKPLNMD